MRKQEVKNYVTGRWVLTVKREPDGSFIKAKARWVLRGFQDRQKWDQQTDSPTSTRPAFRLGCQQSANMQWGLMHIDIKTAFLQGEDYDAVRNVVCQLPPEMGLPPYMGAVLVKPAYGMNDAPRRWWNRLDGSSQRYGLTQTRADQCCYVMYDKKLPRTAPAAGTKGDRPNVERQSSTSDTIESLLEYLLDPVSGSPSRGKHATGYICLHVDDLFASGTPEFLKWLEKMILTEYEIGSLATDNIMFVGQRIRWQGNCLVVDQDGKVDELTEIKIPKGSSDSQKVTASEHTEYRSVLGGLN